MTGLFYFPYLPPRYFDLLTLRLPEAAHCQHQEMYTTGRRVKGRGMMELQTMQLMAGSISSLFFISSNLPMLWKVYKTKSLRSYSFINILFNNIGDAVYWLYIGSLPIGPI